MYSKWWEINKIKGTEGNGNRIFILRLSHQSLQLLRDFISSPVACASLHPHRRAVRGNGRKPAPGLALTNAQTPPLEVLNLFNYYDNTAIYTQAFNLYKGYNSYAGRCGSLETVYGLPFIKLFILHQCHQASIASLYTADTAQLCQTLRKTSYLIGDNWTGRRLCSHAGQCLTTQLVLSGVSLGSNEKGYHTFGFVPLNYLHLPAHPTKLFTYMQTSSLAEPA